MTRLLVCFLISLFLIPQAQAEEEPVLTLHGKPRQGELIFVHTTPGAEIKLNGIKIVPRKDGWFVFGIGRDDKGTLDLTAQQNGKTVRKNLKIIPRKWNIQRVDGLPQNTVTPNPEEEKRIESENGITNKARKTKVEMPVPLCFSRPAEGRISSIYGSQRITNGIPGNQHNALDIANKTGTVIRAPADGVVLLAYDEMLLSGKTVLLGHGQDLGSSYIHLSKIFVKTGQKVKKGDKLGLIGMTGRANGPHLHWTVMWKDKRVDPQVFLNNSARFCPKPAAKKAKAAGKTPLSAVKKGDIK